MTSTARQMSAQISMYPRTLCGDRLQWLVWSLLPRGGSYVVTNYDYQLWQMSETHCASSYPLGNHILGQSAFGLPCGHIAVALAMHALWLFTICRPPSMSTYSSGLSDALWRFEVCSPLSMREETGQAAARKVEPEKKS